MCFINDSELSQKVLRQIGEEKVDSLFFSFSKDLPIRYSLACRNVEDFPMFFPFVFERFDLLNPD